MFSPFSSRARRNLPPVLSGSTSFLFFWLTSRVLPSFFWGIKKQKSFNRNWERLLPSVLSFWCLAFLLLLCCLKHIKEQISDLLWGQWETRTDQHAALLVKECSLQLSQEGIGLPLGQFQLLERQLLEFLGIDAQR